MNFKSQSHILIHHFKLMNFGNLHLLTLLNIFCKISNLEKRFTSLKIKTILWIRKMYSNCVFEYLNWIWLNKSCVWIMRLTNRSRNFSLLFLHIYLKNYFWIIFLKFFFKSFYIIFIFHLRLFINFNICILFMKFNWTLIITFNYGLYLSIILIIIIYFYISIITFIVIVIIFILIYLNVFFLLFFRLIKIFILLEKIIIFNQNFINSIFCWRLTKLF